jgi:L-ascorbate metabolism protein UlaG (beta-lactamase superfamily)
VRHRYHNADPDHRPHGPGEILRWGVIDRLLGRRRISPPGPPAPRITPDLSMIHSETTSPWLTWLGHASFICGLNGRRFLIDPVFSDHAGWVVRRHVPPALDPGDLPSLSAIVVTHNHYDHLDEAAMRTLPAHIPVVVPLGLGRWMRRTGRERVIELGWWQSAEVDGLEITLVPARHWSRRGIFDTNRSLWGGYVVASNGHSVYHSGDTGWFDGFEEIASRFPGLGAAMLPIGGYEPAWFMEQQHLNPEQAGRAFVELEATHLVPMHWGTFQLTDEPLCAPPNRLRDWWRSAGLDGDRSLHVLDVGATLKMEGPQ